MDWTIPADAVCAIDRFDPGHPTHFQAQHPWATTAPIRATRAEAFADIDPLQRHRSAT